MSGDYGWRESVAVADGREGLFLRDAESVPSDPRPEEFYRHRVELVKQSRVAWGRRGVAYALAERDIRSAYKQAALGMLWALISPVLTVIIFTLIFGHVKSLKVPGVPYILYAYVGLICWGFSFSAGR